MRFFIPILLLIQILFEAQGNAIPSDWKAGKATQHGDIKFQSGNTCWAYSTASYLEAKLLKEKGIHIDVSALYIERTHLSRYFQNHFQNWKVQLEGKNQEYLENFLANEEGSSMLTLDLLRDGLMPTVVYEANLKKDIEDPHQVIVNWIWALFQNPQKIIDYLDIDWGLERIREDFSAIHHLPAFQPNKKFNYSGFEFDAESFMSHYFSNLPSLTEIESKPDRLKSFIYPTRSLRIKSVADLTLERLRNIQNILDQGIAIPIAFPLLDVPEEVMEGGFYDPSVFKTAFVKNDPNPTDTLHGALIVNYLQDKMGNLQALVVQNSFGKIGVNENGQITQDPEQKGFSIISLEFLMLGLSVNQKTTFFIPEELYRY